jgi:hypothetical protein
MKKCRSCGFNIEFDGQAFFLAKGDKFYPRGLPTDSEWFHEGCVKAVLDEWRPPSKEVREATGPKYQWHPEVNR